MTTTSSLAQIHSGSSDSGTLTYDMVRKGLKRAGTTPFWIPSASDRARPRGKARPVRTQPAALSRTSSVTKLSVPSWSSSPQRPQFLTLAAIAVNCSEAPIAAAG